jgi:hypothetical protein
VSKEKTNFMAKNLHFCVCQQRDPVHRRPVYNINV